MTPKVRFVVVLVWSAAVSVALFFLLLQVRRTLFFDIDLESSEAVPVTGQVRWMTGSRPFHPADSTTFRLAPGRQKISVRLPVEIDTLQIQPGPAGTRVTIHGLSLRTPVATLRRWGGADAFTGWRETGGLREFAVQGGALKMRVASDDGAFQVDDVAPLRDGARRRAHFRVALVAGFLLGLAQSLGIALLLGQGKPGGRETAAAGNAVAAPKGAWWLLAGTTALCLVAAWFIGRALLKRTSPSVFSDTGDYSLVFVDHLGRRLSEKDGNLKLALDPHSFYRNFPNQRSARFSIDSHGYRGGFDEADPRPRVLALGGSAAFGYGLDSDTDLFTVRLGKIQPRWQVVNAAVVGHLSGQELSELLHHGDEVNPAAVVVLDGWNDLYVPLLAATRFQAAGLGVGFNWDVFQLVESRLRLLTLAGAADEATPGAPEPLPDLVRRITAAYSANITKMKSICAARGVPLLVVLQPWLGTRRAPEPDEAGPLKGWKGIGERADPRLYDTFVTEVRKVLATEGIPCIDLHGAGPFLETPGRLFTDVVHMTPAGQQLAALEIEKPLAALLHASPGSPSAAKNR